MDNPRINTNATVCKNCRWFLRKQDTPVGRCRKYASIMDGFPGVMEDDWCGDFRLEHREAKDTSIKKCTTCRWCDSRSVCGAKDCLGDIHNYRGWEAKS